MADPASLTISVLALAVSSVTAWLTLFRRGTVKMTQPTVIFFGPDTPRAREDTRYRKSSCVHLSSQRPSGAVSSRVCTWRFREMKPTRISISGCMVMRSWCGAAGFSLVKLASLLTISSLPQGTEADFASLRDVTGWRCSLIFWATRKRYGSFRKHWKSRLRPEQRSLNRVQGCTSIGGRIHPATCHTSRSVPPPLILKSL